MSTPSGRPHNLIDPFTADARPGEPPSKGRDDHAPNPAVEQIIAGTHPSDLLDTQRQGQPAADHSSDVFREFEQLATSLRWVPRQEIAARLPRATQLSPVPGLPPFNASGHSHRDFPPEPEHLLPSSLTRSRRDRLRWPLWILIPTIFAATTAYYVGRGTWVPPSARGPQVASVDPTVVAERSMFKEDREATKAREHDTERGVQNEIASQRTMASQTGRLSEGGTVAMSEPLATGIQPLKQAIQALAPEVIKILTEQGERYASAGDFVSARLQFQRAADAGDAKAALALGATYDPNVLAKLGVMWIDADVDKARRWYQQAAHLGSPDAKRRLELLANR